MEALTSREWMLIVGGLILVVVLIDGARRMHRQRRSALRFSKSVDIPTPSRNGDDYNPELPSGGARVLGGGASRVGDDEQGDGASLTASSTETLTDYRSNDAFWGEDSDYSTQVTAPVASNSESAPERIEERVEPCFVEQEPQKLGGEADTFDEEPSVVEPAIAYIEPASELAPELEPETEVVATQGFEQEQEPDADPDPIFESSPLTSESMGSTEQLLASTKIDEAVTAADFRDFSDDSHSDGFESAIAENQVVVSQKSLGVPALSNVSIENSEPLIADAGEVFEEQPDLFADMESFSAEPRHVDEAEDAAKAHRDSTVERLSRFIKRALHVDELEEQSIAEPVAPKRGKKASKAKPQKPEPKQQEVAEVFVIHVMAPKGEVFSGPDLQRAFGKVGLRYGEMSIFHKPAADGSKQTMFSCVNTVVPGTFDFNQMDNLVTPGVSLFMGLPGPADPIEAFADMAETAGYLSVRLGAELQDESRSVLTAQTIEHYRQRIRDYTRKRRLGQGK